MRMIFKTVLAAIAVLCAGVVHAEETKQLRIGVQPGLTYLPQIVMQSQKLIEKKAGELGIQRLEVQWFQSAGGNTMNDGLISGSLDIASTGFPSFLVLWSKGYDRIPLKAISSYGSTELKLVTRNPKVRSIEDLTSTDRIAVPAIKSSVQAMILQMAAAKKWGQDQYDKLDRLTIARSHADAAVALLANSGEINSHFSAPPFLQKELADPGIKSVLSSEDVFGGPLSNGVTYLTEKFHKDNPTVVKAFKAALLDAIDFINKEPAKAADIYIAATNDKSKPEEILSIIHGFKYEPAPRGLGQLATFMKATGSIKHDVADWRDLFIEESRDLDGN